MIEKIPDQIPVQTGEWHGTTFDIIPKETFGMVCRKINELCDIINDITDWIKRTDKTIVKYGIKPIPKKTAQGLKNLQDPYAEQRKWIGKICRFWNDDESLEDSTYGELVNIFDAPHEDYPFQCGWEWYEHCEPVKPDDDIIYRGE